MSTNRKTLLTIVALFAATLPLLLAGNTSNPPGFYVDEASISYNSLLIARTGAGEHGERMPLFFRSSGDYKNPTAFYVLAALFRLLGPSVALARGAGGVAIDLAAALMAWLAWRMSGRRWIAAVTFLGFVATPQLFEPGRVVWEVSYYPLVFALFLLALWRAHQRVRWNASDAILLAVTLALLTYTYTIGRMLGPLFALALLFFASRRRIAGIAGTWLLYALLTVVPIVAFEHAHPGAMTARFRVVADTSVPPLRAAGAFVTHYFLNLDPIGSILVGDANARQHVAGGGGTILAATFVLAAFGIAAAIRRRDPWDRFLLCGLLLSIVPASFTLGTLHALRLILYPLFLIAFSIPALRGAPRTLLATALVLAIGQSAWFASAYIRDGPSRRTLFDAGVPKTLDAALARPQRPIYLYGWNFYPNVFWFAALRGVDPGAFVILERSSLPPANALAITNIEPCPRCPVLARDDAFFTYYTAPK